MEDNSLDFKEGRISRNKKGDWKKSLFSDWVIPIGIAIVLAVLINKFVLYKVYIPSESMVPTLNIGDRLFVTRVYNPENLERGDIVVFDSQELKEKLIKRLIGLPGDNIKIENGKVFVNGTELKEDYIGTQDNFSGEFNVPEGKYFFLGDNRYHSSDSRRWNNPYIDAKDIEAKAQVRVYPFSDFGWIK